PQMHEVVIPMRVGPRGGDMSQKRTWRCFHCDEVFAHKIDARVHFGSSEIDKPICQFNATEFRQMEHELRKHRAEETELHMYMDKRISEYKIELRSEEEKGYARGLADGSKVTV